MSNLYRLVFALFAMVAINLFTPNAALAQPARTRCQQLRDQLDCQNPSAANTATCQSLLTICASEDETIVTCVANNGARLQRRGVHTVNDIITFCQTFAQRPATPSRPRARRQRVFCPDYPGEHNSLVSPRAENRCHGHVVDGVPVCDDGYVPVAAQAYVMRNGHIEEVQDNVLADRCVIDPRSPATQAQITQPIDNDSVCRAISGQPCSVMSTQWNTMYNCVTNPDTAECRLASQLRAVRVVINNEVLPALRILCGTPDGATGIDLEDCRRARQAYLAQNSNGNTGRPVRGYVGLGLGVMAQFPGMTGVTFNLTGGVMIPISERWTFNASGFIGGHHWSPPIGPVLFAGANVAFTYSVTDWFHIGPRVGGYSSFHFWPIPVVGPADNEMAGGYAGLLLRFQLHHNVLLDVHGNIGGGRMTVVDQHDNAFRISGFQASGGLELNFAFP